MISKSNNNEINYHLIYKYIHATLLGNNSLLLQSLSFPEVPVVRDFVWPQWSIRESSDMQLQCAKENKPHKGGDKTNKGVNANFQGGWEKTTRQKPKNEIMRKTTLRPKWQSYIQAWLKAVTTHDNSIRFPLRFIFPSQLYCYTKILFFSIATFDSRRVLRGCTTLSKARWSSST